jgi:hypothetical protein
MEFNDIKIDSKSAYSNTEVGKPGSKQKRLKRMLKEAEAKRKRLETLQKSGLHGKLQAQDELWSDAILNASGEKSITDTNKLRKALKRIEKNKEKSAKEWKARNDLVEEGKLARMEQREKNIQNKKLGVHQPPTVDGAKLSNQTHEKSISKDNQSTTVAHQKIKIVPKFQNREDSSKLQNLNPSSKNQTPVTNRPGFEGKKKADGRFLNEK